MNAIAPIIPAIHRPASGFVSVGDALILALRQTPALRPIADELEARRARD